MPGARCTRGLVCKLHKRKRTRAYRSAEALRHPLRNGFTAYAALSPATNSSCHRHRRIEDFAEPGWARENLRRLDTSNGCQDHTVLPYARLRQKASPGFGAVRPARRLIAHERLALRHRFAPTLPRPPHPLPRFVTIAIRPSCRERTGRAGSADLPDGEREIFLSEGLDGFLPDGR